jgi:lipopolysaccharide export system protein LptA
VIAALALAAALAAPSPPSPSAAAAAASGSKAPVVVNADDVLYSFQKHEVTFAGAPVRMTKDDAVLTCRRLVARTDDAGRIVSAVCSGDVRLARRERVVTCEKATYDDAAERVVCDGNPVLKDGPSEARGVRLVYELKSDEAKLEGAKITLPGEEVEQRQRELEARRKERKR